MRWSRTVAGMALLLAQIVVVLGTAGCSGRPPVTHYYLLEPSVALVPESDGAAGTAGTLVGVRTFHVDARGFLHPCLLWRWSPYNLRKGTPEGWFPLVQMLRSAAVPTRSECLACARRTDCPACPALSRSEVGTAGMPVPYYCSLVGLIDGRSPSELTAAESRDPAAESVNVRT